MAIKKAHTFSFSPSLIRPIIDLTQLLFFKLLQLHSAFIHPKHHHSLLSINRRTLLTINLWSWSFPPVIGAHGAGVTSGGPAS